jgi:DNA repair exonuclease SbcCD ATPase subunit/DNA repair exonuclease SbcCD nuclease subunit
MAKILQISDIHWRGISRHKEYTDSFERLFQKITDIKPDVIVNTGDTYHSKTQSITPEVIERLSWMFRSLADFAPSYTLLGNHDGNLANLDRKDIITPIHEAINHKNAFLLRDSKVYDVPGTNIEFVAYSPFDKKSWDSLRPNKDKISIALFHGSSNGCKMDNGWTLPEGEVQIADFSGYNFVLMGDIHKQQTVAMRLDKHGNPKPWIAYPGSLIQQNFGESENKGFLVWDIRDKDDWDVEFHELENRSPFVSVYWNNSTEETIKDITHSREQLGSGVLPGSRFRIISNKPIPEVQERKIITELKQTYKASDVVFKSEYISRMEDISTNSITLSKKSLKDDPDSLFALYEEYLKAHDDIYKITGDNLRVAKDYIKGYLTKLNNSTPEATHSATWSIKWIEFDNIFCYGEDNRIDLDRLDGLVGIFGPNRAGKSTIIGAIIYALFNTTDRGSIKNVDIINKNKKYCSARIRFSVGGTDYVVERKSERVFDKFKEETGKVTNTVNLFEIVKQDDGQEKKKVKNSISTTDTDKEIRRLIGSPEDFLLTALAAQGDLNRFIFEGATNRKKHLGRFMELDILEKLFDYAKEDLTATNKGGEILSEQEWDRRILSVDKQIQTLNSKIEQARDAKNKYKEKRDNIKVWLSHHEKDASFVGLESIEELTKQLEDTKLEAINKEKSIKHTEKLLTNTQSALTDLNVKVSKMDKESLQNQLSLLLELRTKVQVVKHELDKESSGLVRLEKSIKILETVPCEDKFPSCRFIKDSHSDKLRIDEQRSQVATLLSTLESSEKVLTDLTQRNIESTLQTLSEFEVSIGKHLAEIPLLQERLIRFRSELDQLKQKEKSIQTKIKDLKKKSVALESEEYLNKQKMLSEHEEQISLIETMQSANYQELGSLKDRLNKLTTDKLESKNMFQKIAILTSIHDAFSKRGIPAMVLKTQLPAINQEIAKMLNPIVNFKIELDSDISSNSMDIYLDDGESRRLIELCSGMEKTMCSLAIRVALISLSSLPKPNFFVLDESFGAVDENNQQGCMDMLGLLSSYFKTILIISHSAPIKEIADRIIDITNNGSESKVRA